MSKITTLNQLIIFFEEFATAHAQINDFGYGATSEMATSEQIDYPLMWVTNSDSSNVEKANNNTITPITSFSFIFLDQWNNQSNYKNVNGLNSNNTGEIMSDMEQVCYDLITYINMSAREKQILIPEGSYSIEPAQDEGTDKQFGWILTLDIKRLHINCVIPGNF